MDAAKRKEIAAAWKSRRPNMGVFAVTCTETGDVFLGAAIDTDRAMNGVRARLDGGQHRCKQLQTLWNEHGAEGFEYKVVELLEYDDPKDVGPDDLEALHALVAESMPNEVRLYRGWFSP